MSKPLYFSKAVMGGGKSFSAIQHLCHYTSDKIIYAVPTIELAEEIEATINSQDSSIYPEYGGFEDCPDDENGNRFTNDIHLKVINSDNASGSSVQNNFIEALSKYEHNALIVTHKSLLDLNRPELLQDWTVIIDEDPHPLKIITASDSKLQIACLSKIMNEHKNVIGEITEFEVSENIKSEIKDILTEKHGLAFKDEIKNFLNLIISSNPKKLFFKNSQKKSTWAGIEYLPLNKIVLNAKETHILSSVLSPLTYIYAELFNLEIKSSKIKAKHSEFTSSLQKKIDIYRLWSDDKPHSLERIKNYSEKELVNAVVNFVGGKAFISRTNNNNEIFKKVKNHIERLSKVTNGVNRHTDKSIIVDIAVYNTPPDMHVFYTHIDSVLKFPPNTTKLGIEIQNILEPSAQAVCRIGLRLIDNAPHKKYKIVIPDKRTEDYLKKIYFPEANYMGAIIKDEIKLTSGPVKGSVNPKTITAIKKVKKLNAGGMSLNHAVKKAGTTKSTFNKYKDQF